MRQSPIIKKKLLFNKGAIISMTQEKNQNQTPMNGISAFRSSFSCKKNKKMSCKALKIILILGVFFMVTCPATRSVFGMEIRQDLYGYSSAIYTPARIPLHQTFVIKQQPSFLGRPESHPFPEVHFDLGSAWLSLDASSKLLTDMRECCPTCPLYLTGYTCSLGVEGQNQKLSRQRAETVAALLRKNGFKVASVEGKGMLIGDTPENRRVDIKLSPDEQDK
jgi:hypothetical protein